MAIKWLTLADLPSALSPREALRWTEFAAHLLQQARSSATPTEFLKSALPEIAAELGVSALSVIDRAPSLTLLQQHGRPVFDDVPVPFAAEATDRDVAGQRSLAPGLGTIAVAPLRIQSRPAALLVTIGKTLPDDLLPELLVAGRVLGAALEIAEQLGQQQRHVQQLKTLLSIAATWNSLPDVEQLLEQIAVESTKLLECDRASIFLWDREHRELVARPALGVAGGSLRLPDRTGIVGEVLHSGRIERIDDAYADERFSQKVDQASGYRTRNLLCVPMSGSDRQILGVFEVINKLEGAFTAADEDLLQDLAAQVVAALTSTRERESLLRSHRQLTEQVTRGVAIIGDSPAISALRSTVRRLAETDLPVLILGESGTGKEVVAQALHYQGSRADRPFIAVNCAALAETLLESELFGHEKGAFTDARELRRGKFELAEGGTIFLDEIGDMSPGGQAKLLRVLEQKVITRVGGSQAIPINVRVLAATNAKLADAVRAKKFREDLYFRLNVVTLDLPPLRERPDDVVPLAEHFLQMFSLPARRPKLSLSGDAKRRLQAHAWPGNVRELRNLMERVAFLAAKDEIAAEDLAFVLSPEKETIPEPSENFGLSDATNVFQQDYIRRAVRRVRGNMSEAAKLLGLHRSNLYRKMRQLGMSEASQFRDEEE